MSSYVEGLISSNEEVGKNIYKISISGKFKGQPGQFYMVRAWEGLEPILSRPLSIYDLEGEMLSFLYQVKGRGTKLISRLKTGESLEVLGPLGRPFPLDIEGKNLGLVGGGIGLAPLYYLGKKLREKSRDFKFYLGFREEAYLVEDFKALGPTSYSLEKGGANQGYIVDFLPKDLDLIYSCGPMAMLETLYLKNKDKKIYLSTESRMACGIGACIGCSIETEEGYLRVCKEGPVFEAREVFYSGY